MISIISYYTINKQISFVLDKNTKNIISPKAKETQLNNNITSNESKFIKESASSSIKLIQENKKSNEKNSIVISSLERNRNESNEAKDTPINISNIIAQKQRNDCSSSKGNINNKYFSKLKNKKCSSEKNKQSMIKNTLILDKNKKNDNNLKNITSIKDLNKSIINNSSSIYINSQKSEHDSNLNDNDKKINALKDEKIILENFEREKFMIDEDLNNTQKSDISDNNVKNIINHSKNLLNKTNNKNIINYQNNDNIIKKEVNQYRGNLKTDYGNLHSEENNSNGKFYNINNNFSMNNAVGTSIQNIAYKKDTYTKINFLDKNNKFFNNGCSVNSNNFLNTNFRISHTENDYIQEKYNFASNVNNYTNYNVMATENNIMSFNHESPTYNNILINKLNLTKDYDDSNIMYPSSVLHTDPIENDEELMDNKQILDSKNSKNNSPDLIPDQDHINNKTKKNKNNKININIINGDYNKIFLNNNNNNNNNPNIKKELLSDGIKIEGNSINKGDLIRNNSIKYTQNDSNLNLNNNEYTKVKKNENLFLKRLTSKINNLSDSSDISTKFNNKQENEVENELFSNHLIKNKDENLKHNKINQINQINYHQNLKNCTKNNFVCKNEIIYDLSDYDYYYDNNRFNITHSNKDDSNSINNSKNFHRNLNSNKLNDQSKFFAEKKIEDLKSILKKENNINQATTNLINNTNNNNTNLICTKNNFMQNFHKEKFLVNNKNNNNTNNYLNIDENYITQKDFFEKKTADKTLIYNQNYLKTDESLSYKKQTEFSNVIQKTKLNETQNEKINKNSNLNSQTFKAIANTKMNFQAANNNSSNINKIINNLKKKNPTQKNKDLSGTFKKIIIENYSNKPSIKISKKNFSVCNTNTTKQELKNSLSKDKGIKKNEIIQNSQNKNTSLNQYICSIPSRNNIYYDTNFNQEKSDDLQNIINEKLIKKELISNKKQLNEINSSELSNNNIGLNSMNLSPNKINNKLRDKLYRESYFPSNNSKKIIKNIINLSNTDKHSNINLCNNNNNLPINIQNEKILSNKTISTVPQLNKFVSFDSSKIKITANNPNKDKKQFIDNKNFEFTFKNQEEEDSNKLIMINKSKENSNKSNQKNLGISKISNAYKNQENNSENFDTKNIKKIKNSNCINANKDVVQFKENIPNNGDIDQNNLMYNNPLMNLNNDINNYKMPNNIYHQNMNNLNKNSSGKNNNDIIKIKKENLANKKYISNNHNVDNSLINRKNSEIKLNAYDDIKIKDVSHNNEKSDYSNLENEKKHSLNKNIVNVEQTKSNNPKAEDNININSHYFNLIQRKLSKNKPVNYANNSKGNISNDKIKIPLNNKINKENLPFKDDLSGKIQNINSNKTEVGYSNSNFNYENNPLYFANQNKNNESPGIKINSINKVKREINYNNSNHNKNKDKMFIGTKSMSNNNINENSKNSIINIKTDYAMKRKDILNNEKTTIFNKIENNRSNKSNDNDDVILDKFENKNIRSNLKNTNFICNSIKNNNINNFNKNVIVQTESREKNLIKSFSNSNFTFDQKNHVNNNQKIINNVLSNKIIPHNACKNHTSNYNNNYNNSQVNYLDSSNSIFYMNAFTENNVNLNDFSKQELDNRKPENLINSNVKYKDDKITNKNFSKKEDICKSFNFTNIEKIKSSIENINNLTNTLLYKKEDIIRINERNRFIPLTKDKNRINTNKNMENEKYNNFNFLNNEQILYLNSQPNKNHYNNNNNNNYKKKSSFSGVF